MCCLFTQHPSQLRLDGDTRKTHTDPTVVLLLETLYNYDGILLSLRGCKWSAEATQGGTNNPFITITP